MADRGRSPFRQAGNPLLESSSNSYNFVPPILPTDSHDSATSWIDIDNEPSSSNMDETIKNKGRNPPGRVPDDDDNDVGDDSCWIDAREEDVSGAFGHACEKGDDFFPQSSSLHPQQQITTRGIIQPSRHQQQAEESVSTDSSREESGLPRNSLAEPLQTDDEGDIHTSPELLSQQQQQQQQQSFVEITTTRSHVVEGYDWEGILDFRNRIMALGEERREDSTASASATVRWVTEFRLYLADGSLEAPTEEASLALNTVPRYEILDDTTKCENTILPTKNGSVPTTSQKSICNKSTESVEETDFVEFVPCNSKPSIVTSDAPVENARIPTIVDDEEEEGFASLALSPLDVLTNSLVGARAFHERQGGDSSHCCLCLTELVLGGPTLELSESGIARLASALVQGRIASLARLVLMVQAVDSVGMTALGQWFRLDAANSLQDLQFCARTTTERLVGSSFRYQRVPPPKVLGPGIAGWVDAWASHTTRASGPASAATSTNTSLGLRSLNLSKMDIGDEAAFALSRLLLVAPQLEVLNLAQDDREPSTKMVSSMPEDSANMKYPPLSFSGTKRLLESLILIEDLKKQHTALLPLTCSNLVELDLSGWILEDDCHGRNNGTGTDDDDDKAIDNYYDDYNYIDDGNDDSEFDFADQEEEDGNLNCGSCSHHHKAMLRKDKRACCVVASMLRVNTSLKKLVLTPEDSESSRSGHSPANHPERGRLSVRSTLAIARALRDHISTTISNSAAHNHHKTSLSRPRGSNLRKLVISTDYTTSARGGRQATGTSNCSSWVISERKRAVAKTFCQALRDRPIHVVRLEELSCTRGFTGLSASALAAPPDMREQMESLLQRNRSLNQSLERIHTFWLPRVSSLDARDVSRTEDDDDEVDDCEFVEAIIDSDLCTRNDYNPPPLVVLILPNLLAKASAQTAASNVTFGVIQCLVTDTDLWEAAAEHRGQRPSF